MKYLPSMPSWLKIASFFLLLSLATIFIKKTFFSIGINLHIIFILISFVFFGIAVYKKQITIVLPRSIIYGIIGIIGALLVGTCMSWIMFDILAPDAIREYIRIFITFAACIEIYVIGKHQATFAKHALIALAVSAVVLPLMIYAPFPLLSTFLWGPRFAGLLGNPVFFALFQILPTFILLWILFRKSSTNNLVIPLISFLLFSVSIVSLVWSGSRGGIGGLVVGFIILLGFFIWKLKWKAFLPALIIGLGIGSAYFLTPSLTKEHVTHRIEDVASQSSNIISSSPDLSPTPTHRSNLLTGRALLWKNAFHKIKKNPLGYGPGYADILHITDEFGNTYASHNIVLQTLLSGGVLLLIILGIGLYALGKRFIVSNPPLGEVHYLIAAFIGMLFTSLFIDALWSRWIWILIPLIILYTTERVRYTTSASSGSHNS